MIFLPGNCQHIGARGSQQDAFGFSDKDDTSFVAHGGVLALVADGMGGMALGDVASHLAVRVFLQTYMAKQPGEPIASALLRALEAANRTVTGLSMRNEEAGSTLVAAVAHGESLHWISAGDSRLYLWRAGQLVQLSRDHVYASELDREAALGRISRKEAQNHPERHALTSYLGLPQLDEVDCNPEPFPLLRGDRILLCSDGLHAALSEDEIAATLGHDAQRAAGELVEWVLMKKRPNQDNMTAVILQLWRQ